MRSFLSILLFLSFSMVLCASVGDSILHFPFDEADFTEVTREVVSDIEFSVANHFNRPERISAVQGSALRFDGYSTYASASYTMSGISDLMTIEAWYATEAFSASTDGDRNAIEDAAIISQISNNAGFALMTGPYGKVIFEFHADGINYRIKTAASLEKYVWNHIVATIDLTKDKARIYVNGSLWKQADLASHSSITISSEKLYVGKHNENAYAYGFNLTTVNGALDDIKIFASAFTESEVRSRYEALAPPISGSELYEDFEAADYGNWTVSGDAFGSGPANGTLPNQQEVSGFLGEKLVNSYLDGDGTLGKLTSPGFTISHNRLKFLIGGGNHPGECAFRLVVNNEVVVSATGNDSEMLSEHTWKLDPYMGQTAHFEIIDSVTGGWGHILVDHIVFSQDQKLLQADLFIDPNIRHGDDYLRPKYHPMPNTSWTNEPYGLTYYKGRYHLFFQKNPNGPYLHFMHWGHISSPDLVDWREDPIVLAPSPGFDNFGVWSGTTITNQDGKPVIAYTGVDLAKAGIGLAYPQDDSLLTWEKYSGNPVVAAAPPGTMDFRDPFIWKDGDLYYMIVGSGKSGENGGTLPTYRSEDLINWVAIPSLHSTSDPTSEGYFWEMPFFYQLEGNTYVLGIGPLFTGKRARLMYWTGTWENERFTPFFDKPRKLELGDRDLLAPAIGRDAFDRITYIGILPEDRSGGDQVAAGWRHTFSLPRAVRLLNDNSLGIIPHPNLCRLRGEQVQIVDKNIASGTNFNLPEVSGNQVELDFRIKADSASVFSVQVYKHEDATEFTSVKFELDENRISLDRRYSSHSETTKDVQYAKYNFDFRDTIKVRIFLDHSTIEVFIDDLTAFSSRVYPSRVESDKVDLVVAEGEVHLIRMDAWQLRSLGDEMGSEVCKPSDLPEEFRTNTISSTRFLAERIEIYPNPSKDFFFIHLPERDKADLQKVDLFSSNGRFITSIGQEQISDRILLENIPSGVYFVHFIGKNDSRSQKLIIQR
jgi:sucrose-6-phosphate hydrolase SacC (GH32 family)